MGQSVAKDVCEIRHSVLLLTSFHNVLVILKSLYGKSFGEVLVERVFFQFGVNLVCMRLEMRLGTVAVKRVCGALSPFLRNAVKHKE